MMYEVTSKRVGQDAKGNDREYVEKFLIDNCELCAEAESKCLEFWNGENDVISVKQSKVREFVNERVDDDQDIYLATIEDVFVNEATGEKKATKYIVGLFAVSTESAMSIVTDYMRQGLSDLILTSIRKTNIVELLK